MTTPATNSTSQQTSQAPSVPQILPTIPLQKVVVHPLVLLSVVDHFNRMKQVGNTRRVVGLLLGSLRNKVLDISNSFAG
jgi:26S proteasome regulatory subunit N8